MQSSLGCSVGCTTKVHVYLGILCTRTLRGRSIWVWPTQAELRQILRREAPGVEPKTPDRCNKYPSNFVPRCQGCQNHPQGVPPPLAGNWIHPWTLRFEKPSKSNTPAFFIHTVHVCQSPVSIALSIVLQSAPSL